eukprot:CAMPEP_0117427124 /NCGR_PEP_ID=MMETSP0758-20121206/7051_1 /TAXON_ID=63605 /ORGANISM="Percolomonas cosmopolitus, Strain AE-1 (ATCC 50343)" /LENGTH=606 /DNA_ID=CAMNT_0005212605 /DNA_START=258 /DNA_END=2075 /DNA_ORIENTATION=+
MRKQDYQNVNQCGDFHYNHPNGNYQNLPPNPYYKGRNMHYNGPPQQGAPPQYQQHFRYPHQQRQPFAYGNQPPPQQYHQNYNHPKHYNRKNKTAKPVVNGYSTKGKLLQIEDYVYYQRDVLGQGQFGVVYKGVSRLTNEEVAIKVVRNDNPSALKREIRTLQALRGSPNVIRFFDYYGNVDLKNDTIYIITEICTGGDLEQFIRREKSLSKEQIHRFLKDIARGLQSMYKVGYVHRDLKPANILLTKDHELKFSDFGLARDLENNTLAQSYCGTPYYMAPEILSKKSYDANVDLYSVGVILYQMIYGKYPHNANDIHTLTKMSNENPIQYPKNANLTPELKEVLQLLLETNSKARAFQSFFEHPLINLPLEEESMKPVQVVKQDQKPASENEMIWNFFDSVLSHDFCTYQYPSYVVDFHKVKFHDTNHGHEQYARLLRTRCETYWYMIEAAALLLQGGSTDAAFSVLIFAGGRIKNEIQTMDSTLVRLRLDDSDHMKFIRKWCMDLLKNINTYSKKLYIQVSKLDAAPAPVPQLTEFTVKLASHYSTKLQCETTGIPLVAIFRRVRMILRFLSESPYNSEEDQKVCRSMLDAVIPLQQRLHLDILS